MKYKNRKTGEIFIHLAHAVNLDGLNPVSVVIFCPEDNEHSIFTMAVDLFNVQFQATCEICYDLGLIDGLRFEPCYQLGMNKELQSAA